MKKIGLTGGIGSGKTTVSKIFASIGIPIYYADPRAKWLMNHNRSLKEEIKKVLGPDAYYRNGRLNRPYVANLIFNDPTLLEAINNLVHPAVHKDVEEWIGKQKEAPYILYEAALLIENGSYKNFDGLIVVTAPKALRIKRVMKRDKLSEKAVKQRIKNQLPQSHKDTLADYLIINDQSQALIPQVQKIHQKIINDK